MSFRGNLHLKPTIPLGLEGKYLDFLTNEDFTEVCWIGGFGTAKTDALVTSIIDTAFNYPGARMALCRDQLTNLKRTTLVDLLDKMPELIAHHDKTHSIITFPAVPDHEGVPRSSTLYCFGLLTGDYIQKLKSLQPFRIFWDEGDKMLEEQLDMCILRCRQKVYHRETGEIGRNQVKVVANDEGSNWLWRRFVGKPHPGMEMTPEWAEENINKSIREELFRPETINDLYPGDLVTFESERWLIEKLVDNTRVKLKGRDDLVHFSRLRVVLQRKCLYAFSHENKSLNQQNLKNSRLVSQAMRDRYILGRVDTETGLMFPEFTPHVNVIPPQSIPREWKVVVGIDHGTDHPTAAVFVAVDTEGNCVVFDEYEQSGLSASKNAENIGWTLGEHQHRDVVFYGDTQMWNADPRRPNESIATDYKAAGINPLRKANKVRDISVQRIKDWLRSEQTIYRPTATARLVIMSNCKRLIYKVNSITWSDFNAERDDDLIDALRYAVMGVYSGPARATAATQRVTHTRPFGFGG